MWCSSWLTEILEMRVMRTSIWMVLALLIVTMTAVAQQSAPQAQNPQAANQPASQAASQPASGQPLPPAALPAPVTMNDVVDRVIEREKGLIKMLGPRTPVV